MGCATSVRFLRLNVAFLRHMSHLRANRHALSRDLRIGAPWPASSFLCLRPCYLPLLAALLLALPELSAAAESAAEAEVLRDILKETVARAEATNRLALIVLGGSVAALLSTSYLQPRTRRVRLMYVLFLPGWFLLMWSLYRGQEVYGVYLSALHVANEPPLYYQLETLWRLEEQSAALYLSLVPFSLWLVIFLLWWICQGERRATPRS